MGESSVATTCRPSFTGFINTNLKMILGLTGIGTVGAVESVEFKETGKGYNFGGKLIITSKASRKDQKP